MMIINNVYHICGRFLAQKLGKFSSYKTGLKIHKILQCAVPGRAKCGFIIVNHTLSRILFLIGDFEH